MNKPQLEMVRRLRTDKDPAVRDLADIVATAAVHYIAFTVSDAEKAAVEKAVPAGTAPIEFERISGERWMLSAARDEALTTSEV